MASQQNTTSPTRVFVYGTLKKGFANHQHKMQPERYQNCTLISAHAKTLHSFPLIIAGERHVPYLMDYEGKGHQIQGEVYEVRDEGHLLELDQFEGCDVGHYRRVLIDILIDPTKSTTTEKCYVYMRNKQEGDDELLKQKEMIPCFTEEHNMNYSRASEHVG
ncbi:hypothetical protein C9374_011018 [Naegleria lovaniensis]|uniref:Gamma-glutamylcyclotransferase family protein n=1 Tax=Naegleria lovaniensis TaxID=51637 RepID=A0AA88KFL6_NAELO|nr:uncharacterized protein C9374_011018 [Naegleria lovaniensis]KAG2374181.1 hypothetical protein C9374_011018 [Naegleria lovaniensis]